MADDLDEQAREFFYHLGIAITDWAHIDEQLFHICAGILKTNTGHAAIIYYRIQTIGDVWWASYKSATERLRSNSNKDLRIDDVKDHLKKVSSLFIRLRNFRDELSPLL
jgi:hypothetical protein